MMETPRQKQSRFLRMVGDLFDEAHRRGYQLTFGESFRSDEQAEINALGPSGREQVARLIEASFPLLAGKLRNNGKSRGIRNTAHGKRLAIDLNLFRDGKYLDKTEDWTPLGEWWERQAPDARWGGRFEDGNHFSLEDEGVK